MNWHVFALIASLAAAVSALVLAGITLNMLAQTKQDLARLKIDISWEESRRKDGFERQFPIAWDVIGQLAEKAGLEMQEIPIRCSWEKYRLVPKKPYKGK